MPSLNREDLQKRLVALKSQLDNHVAQVNLVSGAIQVMEQLITEWDAVEVPAKAPAEKKVK